MKNKIKYFLCGILATIATLMVCQYAFCKKDAGKNQKRPCVEFIVPQHGPQK